MFVSLPNTLVSTPSFRATFASFLWTFLCTQFCSQWSSSFTRPNYHQKYLGSELSSRVSDKIHHLRWLVFQGLSFGQNEFVDSLHLLINPLFYSPEWLWFPGEGRGHSVALKVGCIVVNFWLDLFIGLADPMKYLLFFLLLNVVQKLFSFHRSFFEELLFIS